MQFFDHRHLPPYLQPMSKSVGDLAHAIYDNLPEGPEKSAGLRKLLEARDCFVRALVEVEANKSAPKLTPAVKQFGITERSVDRTINSAGDNIICCIICLNSNVSIEIPFTHILSKNDLSAHEEVMEMYQDINNNQDAILDVLMKKEAASHE